MESAWSIAQAYAELGETAQALDWLDRSYEKREPYLVNLRIDPWTERLKTEPRFQALV